jgi:hypothetical protein
MEETQLGRRVFFVAPPSVVQDQLIDLLIQGEFEVSIVKNPQALFTLVDQFPYGIFFLNTEAPLVDKYSSWDTVIDEMRRLNPQGTIRIGVMGYNTTPEMAQHFLIDKEVECGYIQLKLGLAQTAKILLKTLEINEARGRRKFIRVPGIPGKNSLSIRTAHRLLDGTLMDISTAGMAVILNDQSKLLSSDESLDDIQMRLWGSLFSVKAKLMGKRLVQGKGMVHVLLFDPPIDGPAKLKLHSYIKRVIQQETDKASAR